MLNFTLLRKDNRSFIGTSEDFNDYKKWASEQVCEFCGSKSHSRPRDKEGNLLDVWLTETDCGCKFK